MKTNQCDRKRIDEFFRDETVGTDIELSQHLETCDNCRQYFDSQAAQPEQWAEARRMLQQTEFDVASTAEFSAGGQGDRATRQTVSIQAVLDSLAPSDDPHRLGRLGGYEVSGVVGVGGMGVVLKAVDPSLDRVVAIKVMAPHLANSATARKRFSREAKAAAAVLHPNVIPIHCVSSDDAVPYLVTAYIRGGSLQKRLEREGPLPTVEILRIGSQVAAGLAAAHEQGLVHRDIKPENILLEEGVERITLTDFGLARAVDDASVTRDGTIAGTPQYMSPEQARGESVDQKSDLFSLGSVLYALCTGHPPFRAESSYGVMRRISDAMPTPIRELNPDIPRWLSDIIDRLMAKEKVNRFDSASEVHELLDACLSHVQQPTNVPLPHRLLPQVEANRAKPSLMPQTLKGVVMLTAIIVLGISGLGLLGIRGCDGDKHSESEVKAAYEEVRSYYGASKDVFPGNPINVLLVNNTGREYLKKLDQEFDRIAYAEGDFSYGFTQFVVYMCDNRTRPKQLEIDLTARREGYQKGAGVGFPDQIKPNSVRIQRHDWADGLPPNNEDPDGQLVIGFTASNDAEDRESIEQIFGLIPGESYSVEIDILDVIEGRVDGIEVWKRGKPQTVVAISTESPDDNDKAEPPAEASVYKPTPATQKMLDDLVKQIKSKESPWGDSIAEKQNFWNGELREAIVELIRVRLESVQAGKVKDTKQTVNELRGLTQRLQTIAQPNESTYTAAGKLAAMSWPLLLAGYPEDFNEAMVELTVPYPPIRVGDKMAEAGRPTEPLGWDVQAAHALALARAGKTKEALKENQTLMTKIDVNVRKGRLPELRLEFLGTTRSQKSLLKQTLLQKSLILAIAGRTVESVDASTAAGHVEVKNPTQDDQSAIQAMLRTLAKAAEPPADNAQTPAESDASAKRKANAYLVEAAKSGDVKAVKAALDAGVDPNGPADRLTALHFAVAQRISDGKTVEPSPEIAKRLIEAGANVNAKDYLGQTPLEWAAKYASPDTVAMLIKAGADVNAESVYGTVLMAAGRIEIAKLLIEGGADVNAGKTMSPLAKAAKYGNVALIQLLVKNGAKVNDPKNPPIHWAGKPEAAKALLEAGADVNQRNGKGETVLHLTRVPAAYGPWVPTSETVKALIETGADVNAKSKSRSTPLHVAVLGGKSEISKLLIAAGADVDAKDKQGNTPLSFARAALSQTRGRKSLNSKPYESVVQLLVDAGATDDGRTPLQRVVETGQLDEVKKLIASKVDVNETGSQRITAVHVASEKGHAEILAALIEAGSKTDQPNAQGMRPLHFAANAEIARTLIANGAKVNSPSLSPLYMATLNGKADVVRELVRNKANVKDSDGVGMLIWATFGGQIDVIKVLLEERDAKTLLKESKNESPLHIAASGSFGDVSCPQNVTPKIRLEIAELLVEQGADVNAGWGADVHPQSSAAPMSDTTPLMFASWKGEIEMVKFLLDQGADVKAANASGQTALHFAAQQGHRSVVELLLTAKADVNALTRGAKTPLDLAKDAEVKVLCIQNGGKTASEVLKDSQ